jgi:nucleotide sugar dehydrogenase
MKVLIIGFGYVGQAVYKLIEHSGNQIYAYDPFHWNDREHYKNINFDVAIICVPTKQNKNGSCDTSIVEQSIKDFKAKRYLIKSTITPGTTKYLSEKYFKRIVFSPEYVGESKYYNPFFPSKMIETPFWIFGGDKEDTSFMIDFFMPILGPTKTFLQMSSLEAEIVKYAENSFFATKITFAQELYDLCKKVGADWNNVREGWTIDPRVGKMHTAVFPEARGFSGKCLPKDTSALEYYMKKSKVDSTLLSAVIKKNNALTKLKKSKRR